MLCKHDMYNSHLLLEAGYKIKEDQVVMEFINTPSNSDTEEHGEKLYQYLWDVIHSPRTLKSMCRIWIRAQLGSVRLEYKINQLPLPQIVKKYLCLERECLPDVLCDGEADSPRGENVQREPTWPGRRFIHMNLTPV